MIVNNFDLPGASLVPHKTNPPLVIDADAILARPVTAQFLQTIRRRTPQIQQVCRSIQSIKTTQCGLADWLAPMQGLFVIKHLLGVPAFETPNHTSIVTKTVTMSTPERRRLTAAGCPMKPIITSSPSRQHACRGFRRGTLVRPLSESLRPWRGGCPRIAAGCGPPAETKCSGFAP